MKQTLALMKPTKVVVMQLSSIITKLILVTMEQILLIIKMKFLTIMEQTLEITQILKVKVAKMAAKKPMIL